MHNARPFIRIAGYLTLLLSLFTCLPGRSQNLVPNNSFETYTTCPTTYEGLCFGFAPPWLCASQGSSDLFNACGNPSMAGVPDNAIGSQPALTGNGYAGFLCRWPTIPNYREYCKVPLTTPLVAGTWYYVYFYVSLTETSCGVEHIGAYFTTTDLYQSGTTTIDVEPQIVSNTGYLDDQVEWMPVSGCFQAEGGEQYMIIGNFEVDADNPLDPDCSTGAYAYYYLEDVSVTAGDAPEEIPLELGNDVFECFSYEIDPDHDGPFFEWSTGATTPTLTVTASGVYTLTVTDGCNQGVDSVEVTIAGNYPPVDLGPDEVTICNGDEYNIFLDPDLFDYEWQDGSNDPEYSITTTGTYSVTLDDGCLETSDEIDVIVLDPPSPFDLGDDVFLCSGDEIEIDFDPALGDFLWQDGNTSSNYVIDIGGDYAVTISNMCGSESDDLVVTDLEVPEVEIGPDDQVLCSGDILEIEIDEELGDILWNDGSSEPNYEITTSGTYTVFVTNQCGTGSDQINVTVVDAPAVDLGPDLLLCNGQSVLLTTDPIGGSYVWQDNSDADTFLVTSPGTYALSITNLCGTASDDVVIDYTLLVVPPAFGPDINLCPGEQIVLYANNPGANYLWQDLSTADSLLVNTSGTYSLNVSNACNQETDTIIVTVDDSPPQVDLPDQISLCQGQSITLDAIVGGVTYTWNDNSQNQQLLVTTPGTYSLTVSNSCGIDTDTAIILDGGPAPFVALGNDIAICPGDLVTLTPVNSDVTSWLWHDGSIAPDFVVSAGGMVTVQVSNACGISADTLIVNLLPATPPLDLGADTALCSGESFVLSINTPGVTVLWPDGSSATDYSVTGPGLVYAEISNSCGQSFDTVQVNALPAIPDLNLGPDQSLCPGELIVFNPGITDVQYLWQDGSNNTSFQTTQQGTIILSISNECGLTSDTVVIIESTQGPQVDLGADIQVCEGETVTILSGIAGVNYLWQDGSTNPDFTTTQSGTFILQVNNNCGTDSDTLLVDISGVPPTPALGFDTTLCEGVTLNLTSTADTETTIQWQNGSSSPSFIVTSAGTYILSESNRCGDAADTVVVAYLDAPDPFTLGPDTTLCPGETLTLTAPSTAFEIRWQDGSDQSSLIADVANTYTLQLSNDCGVVTDAIQVDFDNRMPQLNLDTSIPWCEGDIITLDATQPFIVQYLWSTGSIAPSIQVSSTGLYSVDVITLCNVVSQNVDVVPGTDCVEPEFHKEIGLPNIFSPNGDGNNDEFALSFGSDLELFSLSGNIYDRWGNLVYHSDAMSFVWDGNFADQPAMPGVYVYTIKAKYNDGTKEREEVLVGDVTLIR